MEMVEAGMKKIIYTLSLLSVLLLMVSEICVACIGIHIYALDEELLIEQLMLDFDLTRKHYLIPVGNKIKTKS